MAKGEITAQEGSFPLTRGKLAKHALARAKIRLIPTHAGKTGNKGTGGVRRRAHPRSRRENLVVSLEECVPVGSSPLTRGKQEYTISLDDGDRLIPAHAGKTRRR